MFYRLLTIAGGLILLASTLYVLINWGQIPDTIPTHFNFKGEADAYGGKGSLVFMIVMAWVVFISLTLSVKFPNLWNFPVEVTEENRSRLFAIARFMMEVMKFITAILFAVIMITIALNVILPQSVMIILLAAMLGLIAVCIILMIKNK